MDVRQPTRVGTCWWHAGVVVSGTYKMSAHESHMKELKF